MVKVTLRVKIFREYSVDWALKANYLSVYQGISSEGVAQQLGILPPQATNLVFVLFLVETFICLNCEMCSSCVTMLTLLSALPPPPLPARYTKVNQR